MRILALVLPSLIAVGAGITGGLVQRRMRPQLAAPLLTGLAVLASAGVVVALALVAFGWAGWCRTLYSHDEVPIWIGLPAFAAIPSMLWTAVRATHEWKASLGPCRSSGETLELMDTDEPLAYAVPGAPGHIVVSVGMLNRLRPDERVVLLAHEQSHLLRRHHRYLWMAHVASAAVPVLKPMRRQVRFATERWADEDASAAVGDRRLVARAITRAALAQADHAALAASSFVGLGVPARVEALLNSDPGRHRAHLAVAATGLAGWVAVTGSALQVERLLAFVSHIC